MSANYVSLTLIVKGMIEIEIVLSSLAFTCMCVLCFITLIQIQFK